jgi:Spy/CpxP family protein refolding chaperone
MHSKTSGAAQTAVAPQSRKEIEMTVQDKLRKTTIVVASALAMTLGAIAVLAQPAGGMPGPHRHGHGGPGGPSDMIGHLIVSAQAQLNLNTSQQQMFDAAVASSKTAMQSGKTLHQSVKDALTAELAKSEPDLGAVAAAADNARAQGEALRQQVRGQWLALYATFSPDQKTVVKNLIQQHMAMAEGFHAQMMERWQNGAGAAGTTN